MRSVQKKRQGLIRRHRRVRRKIVGTTERPRLAVFRSLRHIRAQIIDDSTGRTLCAASSLDPDFPADVSGGNVTGASRVGALIAEKARAAEIGAVVFDRGGRQYHGRVKALADAAREGGLQF
jgi:large subunit ribosomal protein L18